MCGGMITMDCVLMTRFFRSTWLVAVICAFALTPAMGGERISDIRNTKHNFSATVLPDLPGAAKRDAFAATETQICAFCHTPHAATPEPRTPLWNRKLSSASYTTYNSSSLDAVDLRQPGGKSKLCLSCHDGTLAIGAVNVLNRQEDPNLKVLTFDTNATTGGKVSRGDGTMPAGLGENTGSAAWVLISPMITLFHSLSIVPRRYAMASYTILRLWGTSAIVIAKTGPSYRWRITRSSVLAAMILMYAIRPERILNFCV
jgi:hypothetical protein